MLLAAGLGQRMRPLTDHTPKPLLKLGGRALLDHMLDRFGESGVERAVVNAHWQAPQLAAHLAGRETLPRTILRHEDDLLDTGGAVASALAGMLLDPTGFFIANGDTVLLDGPRPALRRMQAALDASVDAVILVHRTFQVHGDIGPGDFFLDPWAVPRRRREREIAPYVYAGITLATAALFDQHRHGRFSMNHVWDSAMAAHRLRAVVHDGLWFHLSRPEDLAEAEYALAAQLTGQTT
jgi:MurNAc alpha-1-phosphate uridylyltransferase